MPPQKLKVLFKAFGGITELMVVTIGAYNIEYVLTDIHAVDFAIFIHIEMFWKGRSI